MANRPVKAGAASAGPDWGLAGRPALAGADAPPPVHHQGHPRAQHDPRLAHDPGTVRGRADDRKENRAPGRNDGRQPNTVVAGLSWLPYLIALAGVALGLATAWDGSRLAVRGTELVGGALLVAALARLLLPSRYAGPLSSRGRASDVAGFAVFGTAVLVVALMLS
jgi:hypothetical protein